MFDVCEESLSHERRAKKTDKPALEPPGDRQGGLFCVNVVEPFADLICDLDLLGGEDKLPGHEGLTDTAASTAASTRRGLRIAGLHSIVPRADVP